MTPRARKFCLASGTAIVALGVLLFVAGRSPEKPTEVSNGTNRSLRYLGVTFGQKHSRNLDQGWRRFVPAILPKAVLRRWSIRGRQVLSFDEAVCVVWADDLHPAGGSWSGVPCEIVDGAGNRYSWESFPQGYFPGAYVFYHYPRRDAKFRVRFGYNYATGYETLLEKEVENRGRREYPTWKPEALPTTKTNHGVSVTLKGFQRHSMLVVRPDIEVFDHGQPVPLAGVAAEWAWDDATGNHPPVDLKDPAWRLRLGVCDEYAVAMGSHETLNLTNITIPAPGVARALGIHCKLEGHEILVGTVGGPGSYTLSNGLIVAAAPFNGTWEIRGTNPSKRLVPDLLQYSSRRPHVLIFSDGLPPNTVLRYRVRDAAANAVPVLEWHTDASGSVRSLEFDVTNSLTSVSIDLAVCPKFQFEFFVKPPAHIPEPTRPGPSAAPKLFRF